MGSAYSQYTKVVLKWARGQGTLAWESQLCSLALIISAVAVGTLSILCWQLRQGALQVQYGEALRVTSGRNSCQNKIRGPDAEIDDDQGDSTFSANRDVVLLVIAHPDDECMFFAPTVTTLARVRKVPTHVVALSTGNSAGLGALRIQELVRSCKQLGLSEAQVHIVDSPELQDGMRERWSSKVILREVKRVASDISATQVVTFDDYGVSGHPNHIALSRALRASTLKLPVWRLRSVSLSRKYLGRLVEPLPDARLRWALGRGLRCGSMWVVMARPAYLERAYAAMRAHVSQYVWFRQIYVRMARYMVINELQLESPRNRK